MKNSKRHLITMVAMLSMLLLFASCGGKAVDTYTENGETESISAEFSDTNAPDTDIDLDEIILPQEDDFSNPDFVIEKGVLVKYLGSDTTVTVPDTVGEIEAYAFSHSSSPEGITEIRLGKNVGKISPKAFFELDNLVKIDTGKNKIFETFVFEYIPESCILYRRDLSVFFCFEYGCGMIDFLDTNFNDIAYILPVFTKVDFVCGDAILQIGRASDYMLFDKVPQWHLFLIQYGSVTKIFDEPRVLNGNFSVYAFEAENAFVFTTNVYNWASGYVITNDEIIEVSDSNFEEDSVSLYRGEDKKLCYKKIDKNYTAMQVDTISPTITSRDQFYSEDGKVRIVNGKLEFDKENTYTLTDYMDWRGTTLDEWYESLENRDYDTLDELMEANKKNLGDKK
ncbi:MAG: hypothetical protein ACI4QZ_07405 [Eubacteriales bacterium]